VTGAAPAGARVAAQAKVNLRLRILAREESGFHQIETLFLRLALADQVRVRRTTGARSLDVHGADAAALGPVEGNLAWRAAVAYAEAGAWTGGFSIELEKSIPVGGGLGGGSADAAGVLRVMNAIAPHPLDVGTLLRLAATLGADVPFLVSDLAYALAWGRGERLLALAPPPVREVVLLVPPFAVNTAAAYGWLAA
jgi:4-diphosphocytidyl-2-C-methyl-D-erythritol kinase